MSEKTANNQQIDMLSTSVHMDEVALRERIGSHGVKLEHWQCYRCPVGMTVMGDNRSPHMQHTECENGFIYEKIGEIYAILTNNSKSKTMTDVGYYDQSATYATFQTHYEQECSQPFLITPLDRFYLAEDDLLEGSNLEIPVWQYFQHSETGIDRLKYPIKRVLALRDNNNVVYKQNVHFVVKNGVIEWITNARPVPSLGVGPGMSGFGSDRGAVCAVRYTIRPYFYVHQILHDLRLAKVDSMDGLKTARLPQQAVLFREYIPQNKTNSETAETSDVLRLITAPPDGGFGPK